MQYLPAVRDALERVPDKLRRQIIKRAESLAINPRPLGWDKIEGAQETLYRVRQGSYRIFYTIEGRQVTIVWVSDRKEAYTKKGRR